jgi:2-polyprenyl-3-methyl-5-hydroxy-6-metoxy-1,4-benzoquinol methylase
MSSYSHRLFVLQRIVAGRICRLLGSLNILLQPKQIYCIKAGYHHAGKVETYDDRLNKDEWQRGVYETAYSLLQKTGGTSVIDTGCGSAYKLIDMFGKFNTTGIELEKTWQWLLEKYPLNNWLSYDHTNPSQLECDLLICSDVIEHLKVPDEMMDFLRRINFTWLVISTPERNSVRGENDFGPPENVSHYREWNNLEFATYVSKWFHVNEQIISTDKSVSQILICKKKSTGI